MNILANLDDLREKVNFHRCTPQTVALNAYFFDENTQNYYNLTVNLIVNMKPEDELLVIDYFEIDEIYLFRNRDEKPRFAFTRAELEDYIDF